MATSRTHTREIEGRDSVGLYLDEIARTPLLDAETEVELRKTIEAGLLAATLLEEGRGRPSQGRRPQVRHRGRAALDGRGGRARDAALHQRQPALVVSIARKYGRSQMPMLDLVQEGDTGPHPRGREVRLRARATALHLRHLVGTSAITRASRSRPTSSGSRCTSSRSSTRSAHASYLERQLGRDPDPEEIAAGSAWTSTVLDLMSMGPGHVSLDTPSTRTATPPGRPDRSGDRAGTGPTVLDLESRDRLSRWSSCSTTGHRRHPVPLRLIDRRRAQASRTSAPSTTSPPTRCAQLEREAIPEAGPAANRT